MAFIWLSPLKPFHPREAAEKDAREIIERYAPEIREALCIHPPKGDEG